MKRFLLTLAALTCAAPLAAEQDVSFASGRFHIEVEGVAGTPKFRITLTETTATEPMEPVNEAGLHMSCLLIPDLFHVSPEDIASAAATGADRYCQAQFGADHIGSVDGMAPHATEPAFVGLGRCDQAPI